MSRASFARTGAWPAAFARLRGVFAGVPAFASRAGAPLLEFVLPQRCPGCGESARPESVLCAACLARVPGLTEPLCAHCLLEGREPFPCARHPYRRVFSPWQYDERAAAVVHALKYGARPRIAAGLGPLLAGAVPPAWRAADLVLEVPLHPARMRERGYNQAASLADALAEALAIPRQPEALRRIRATPPQARLGESARRRNVRGAFAVRHPARLAGRRVLIVDDVLTTGATLDACLAELADAGAKAAGVALAWAS